MASSDTRFKPGQSGNPGGREKGAERRAKEALERREYIARDGQKYTGRDIPLQVLIDIATNEKEKARDRAAASIALLDRTEGKPRQAVDVTGDVQLNSVPASALRPLTEEQLAALAVVDEGLGDDGTGHA
jgi:hypothetical protein